MWAQSHATSPSMYPLERRKALISARLAWKLGYIRTWRRHNKQCPHQESSVWATWWLQARLGYQCDRACWRMLFGFLPCAALLLFATGLCTLLVESLQLSPNFHDWSSPGLSYLQEHFPSTCLHKPILMLWITQTDVQIKKLHVTREQFNWKSLLAEEKGF